MKRKCWLAGLLALLLGLTACSSKPKTVHKVDFQTAPAYIAEDVPLPVQTGDLIGCCTDGETMFILADEQIEEEIESTLFRVSLADGAVELLEQFQSEAIADSTKNTLGPLLAPDGTLWLYEMQSIVYYDLPEDFDPAKDSKGDYYTGRDDFHHLRQLDPETGKEKKIIDLSDAVRTLEVDNIFDVAGVAVDGKGNFYFASTGGVGVLDKNMNYLFTLEAAIPRTNIYSSSGGPLALLPDGSVAVLTVQPGGTREVRTIDVTAKDWGGTKYQVPGSAELLYNGSNGFLFYYTMSGTLCAWEPDAEEGRVLLSWANTDLSGSTVCFAPLDDGKMAALTLSYENGYEWYKGEIRLSMLSPTDKLPSDGKIKLVYGTIGTSAVQRKRVSDFNNESEDYYIELRNYAGEGQDYFDLNRAEREAAKKLLAAEVVSGKAPDIWDTTLPIQLYARKGALEDLWPFIDGDPEISREDLLSHVLDCASIDGKLYQVFNSFKIRTCVANAAVVGDRVSWTTEEMMEVWNSMPEGSTITGPEGNPCAALTSLMGSDLGHWINWDTGECRFDSEEFKTLMRICEGEPDVEWEDRDLEKVNLRENGVYFREGKQLVDSVILNNWSDVLRYEVLMAGPEHLTNYMEYLHENNIYHKREADRREGAVISEALNMADSVGDGKLFSWYPLSEDAVFGALDGGGYVAFIGAPVDTGTGSSFSFPIYGAEVEATWAISASCQNKEGAWQFVRQLLLPGSMGQVKTNESTQAGNAFPIYKEDFDQILEAEYVTDRAGNVLLDKDGNPIEEPSDVSPVPFYSQPGVTHSMVVFELAPKGVMVENFWRLYNAIETIDTYNTNFDLLDLITEPALAYYAGDKSLDETVDLINRRVSLYVNETR